MRDNRTKSQRWADNVTEFSGSWNFIGWFTLVCILWITYNVLVKRDSRFDPYPFLFLNWILTIISTFQNPLILLSQNRQNETDRERVNEILNKIDTLQKTVNELKYARKGLITPVDKETAIQLAKKAGILDEAGELDPSYK